MGVAKGGGFRREELHTGVWFTGCQDVNGGKENVLVGSVKESEKRNFSMDVSFAVTNVFN